jgi:hypothetical protein
MHHLSATTAAAAGNFFGAVGSAPDVPSIQFNIAFVGRKNSNNNNSNVVSISSWRRR